MKQTKRISHLENQILLLQEEAKKSSSLSIENILKILAKKGPLLLLILMSLPFCQPLQIPGLSTPFGIAIAFIGLSICLKKQLYLPKKILSKTIASKSVQTITDKTLIVIRKMRPLIHPRLSFLCRSSFIERIHGFMILILGGFLALPLPIPFSNLAAAWGIFLISIGMLEDDGIWIILGYLVAIMTGIIFLFTAVTLKNFLLDL